MSAGCDSCRFGRRRRECVWGSFARHVAVGPHMGSRSRRRRFQRCRPDVLRAGMSCVGRDKPRSTSLRDGVRAALSERLPFRSGQCNRLSCRHGNDPTTEAMALTRWQTRCRRRPRASAHDDGFAVTRRAAHHLRLAFDVVDLGCAKQRESKGSSAVGQNGAARRIRAQALCRRFRFPAALRRSKTFARPSCFRRRGRGRWQ